MLDTNHASLIFRRLPAALAAVEAHADDEFALAMPTVAELWYMEHGSARRAENIRDLVQFFRDYQILEFSASAAEEFGRIKADLRVRGRIIPDRDIQIAAIALCSKLTLLTSDKHFRNLTG